MPFRATLSPRLPSRTNACGQRSVVRNPPGLEFFGGPRQLAAVGKQLQTPSRKVHKNTIDRRIAHRPRVVTRSVVSRPFPQGPHGPPSKLSAAGPAEEGAGRQAGEGAVLQQQN
eukprot:8643853-Pyramimonas_sp.AAC.2